MLKRLGRQLTLLNVLISGAILIAMALVSLSVTEGMILSQNERDLRGTMGSLVTAMTEIDRDDVRVRMQIPQKYSVFIEDQDAQQWLITDQPVSAEVAQYILPQMREQIDEQQNNPQTTEPMPTRFYVAFNRIALQRDAVDVTVSGESEAMDTDTVKVKLAVADAVDTAEDDAEKLGVVAAADAQEGNTSKLGDTGVLVRGVTSPKNGAYIAQSETVAVTLNDFMLSTIDDTPYRIAASVIGEGEPGEMLLVMQNQTDEYQERNRLRWIYALCVLGALTLIVLGSLFYSAKAVAPIENSIRRQQEFVSAASHELRTPIASVRANAEVLGDADIGEYSPYLGAILSESEKMSKLVSDLLHLARADAGELPVAAELVDAAEVAQDAARLVLPLAQKRSLTLHQQIQPALLMGDANRLRQVLIALLDNATAYAHEGGDVWLVTARRDQLVEIRVEDNGPGIPGEHKARVFDRFYRVDTARSRDHGGAGLGLSIAKELVERMHGSIQLRDREGGGSVFSVSFPVVK